jgi:ribonuclease-3
MRPTRPGPRGRLARALSHHFARPELLEQAVTHPSAASPARPHNQRLEFLGDRVLGLIIAEALLEAYPDEDEGTLAPRLNALVRRETLAEVAAEIGLGEYLLLGRSEATGGGRRKKAILADAMEAVIAALYLDGGMEAARRLVLARWQRRIEAPDTAPTDAKTRLQEWAQGRGMAPPAYAVTAREGPDHAPRFTVEASLASGERALGEAASKKEAEQAAAQALLARLGLEGDGDGR